MHVIHYAKAPSPAGRDRAGDVYGKVRVPEPREETGRPKPRYVRLGRRLPDRDRRRDLEHGQHRLAPGEDKAPPRCRPLLGAAEVPRPERRDLFPEYSPGPDHAV